MNSCALRADFLTEFLLCPARHVARVTTNSINRFRGARLAFRRHTMTAIPYFQRRFAVARLMPNSQQIGFHGVLLAFCHAMPSVG